MKTIFWNAEEGRLRTLWRFGLLGLILFLSRLLFDLLFLAPVAAFYYATTPEPLGLSHPDLYNTLQGLVYGSPWVLGVRWIFDILVLLAGVWLAGRWADRRPLADYGFHLNRRWWIDLGFGMLLGALLMAAIFAVEYLAGWVTITGTFKAGRFGFWPGLLAVFIMFTRVAVEEELISRGYLLRNLAEGFNFPRLGPRGALLVAYLGSSIIFGLLHLGNPNSTWVSTFNLAVAGLFLGLGYVLTGELAIPIGLHLTWNFFQGNIFGFPVSGGQAGTSLIAIEQSGPVVWTGGAFGPEAGLIGLLAIATGSLLTVAWVRRGARQAALRDTLAVYTPG